MQARRLGAVLGTVLFLGAAGLTQAVTVNAAVAAPAGQTIDVQRSDDRDFRQGLRAGFKDGWEMAREECEMYRSYAFKLHDDDEDDYARGYERGFDRGFAKGFKEYCD